MKSSATILVLLALLALIPCTEGMAQTLPAAVTPSAASTVTAPTAPATVAEFLESLSSGPKLVSTLCNTDANCPTGQLCCYPCGIEGCHNVCMTPFRGGECPLFP